MKVYPSIPPSLQTWAQSQPLFIVASAPLKGRHVNASPKGIASSTFKIFDESHCGYVDFTGSGNETISHIYERGNGRVTVMFMSFDVLPRILRFYCTAEQKDVVEKNEDVGKWKAALARFGLTQEPPGARACIFLRVDKCITSCGKSVPVLDLKGEMQKAGFKDVWEASEMKRGLDYSVDHDEKKLLASDVLVDRFELWKWAQNMEAKNDLIGYRERCNTASLDDLPGLRTALASKHPLWKALGSIGRALDANRSLLELVISVIVLLLLAFLFQHTSCKELADESGRLRTYCSMPMMSDIRVAFRSIGQYNMSLPWVAQITR